MHTLLFAITAIILAAAIGLGVRIPLRGSRQRRLTVRLFLLALLPVGGITLSIVMLLMVGRECFAHCATWDKVVSLAITSLLLASATWLLARDLLKQVKTRHIVGCLPCSRDSRLAPVAGGLPVRVLASSVPIACLVGLRRPTVLLSTWMLENLDEAELEAVVSHEVAHHARKDAVVVWLANILGRMVPTRAARRLRADILDDVESAADEFAAQETHKPAALASALVKVFQKGHSGAIPRWSGANVIPFARRRTGILKRVTNLLREGQGQSGRRAPTALLPLALALAAVVATLGFLPFQLMVLQHEDLCSLDRWVGPVAVPPDAHDAHPASHIPAAGPSEDPEINSHS